MRRRSLFAGRPEALVVRPPARVARRPRRNVAELLRFVCSIGGLISARKVLETLARKLTPLPLPESLTASLTTATLVCLASWKGLPVSTTHVSTGAIIGAGLKNNPKDVRWKKVTEILLSWIITLPAAAFLAAAAKLLIN